MPCYGTNDSEKEKRAFLTLHISAPYSAVPNAPENDLANYPFGPYDALLPNTNDKIVVSSFSLFTMFDRLSSPTADGKQRKRNAGPVSRAGATPFHRRESYIPQAKRRGQFKWLIYDNNGSYNGWFDWLPIWMRVGYFSPFVIASLMFFYSAIYWYRPQPLQFEATIYEVVVSGKEFDYFFGIMPKTAAVDLAIFLWGVVVVAHAKITFGSIGAFPISFTGWSWLLLSLRAGVEFAAWAATSHDYLAFGKRLAVIGSSLRLVALTNACVVCTIWNFILFPLIYFFSIPAGEKRQNFLKFNFGFFMTNIHVLNFPIAIFNTVYGNQIRLFTFSDLWVAYLVIILYSIVYFFIMDRLGMHFYPIFCPRSALSVGSIVGVLGLYYYLFLKWNELISSRV